MINARSISTSSTTLVCFVAVGGADEYLPSLGFESFGLGLILGFGGHSASSSGRDNTRGGAGEIFLISFCRLHSFLFLSSHRDEDSCLGSTATEGDDSGLATFVDGSARLSGGGNVCVVVNTGCGSKPLSISDAGRLLIIGVSDTFLTCVQLSDIVSDVSVDRTVVSAVASAEMFACSRDLFFSVSLLRRRCRGALAPRKSSFSIVPVEGDMANSIGSGHSSGIGKGVTNTSLQTWCSCV